MSKRNFLKKVPKIKIHDISLGKIFKKATLKNGLVLLAEKHPHVKTTSIAVWVGVGSMHEGQNERGLSHALEHMVFKGTRKRNAFEIATALECVGSELNAFTDKEYTCFHANLLSEHLDLALDVLSDLIIHAQFPKQELEREKKVLIQELTMTQDNPEDIIYDEFMKRSWSSSPLGQPIIGEKKIIEQLTKRDLKKFYKHYYRPENIVISVAGNIEFSALQEKVEKYFHFPHKPRSSRLSTTQSQRSLIHNIHDSLSTRKHFNQTPFQPFKTHIKSYTDQTHILVGYESLSIHDPNRFHLLLLSFFLGGGMMSKLFQQIREVAGLAYSVDTDFIAYKNAGLFTIYCSVQPCHVTQCLKIISKEIKSLVDKPISEEDLALVKNQLKGTILLSSEQMEARQESLGRNFLTFSKYIPIEEVLYHIQKVTSETLHEVCKTMFQPSKEAILTLGKKKPRTIFLNTQKRGAFIS